MVLAVWLASALAVIGLAALLARSRVSPGARPCGALLFGRLCLSLGSLGARLRRLAGDHAGTSAAAARFAASLPVLAAIFCPDLRARRADRICDRMGAGLLSPSSRSGLPFSAWSARSKFLLGVPLVGVAADHGDVSALLAVEKAAVVALVTFFPMLGTRSPDCPHPDTWSAT